MTECSDDIVSCGLVMTRFNKEADMCPMEGICKFYRVVPVWALYVTDPESFNSIRISKYGLSEADVRGLIKEDMIGVEVRRVN